MSLRLADALVKKGDYEEALRVIQKTKEKDPRNKYADAYRERVLALLRESATAPELQSDPGPSIAPPVETGAGGLLSAESRLRSIATPITPRPAEDEKTAAIKSKVASLLGSANQYLAQQRYAQALETVGRASLLDPQNKEVQVIESRIRAAQEDSHRRTARERQEREWEDRLRREDLLKQELDRLKVERQAKREHEESRRRVAHEQKIGQSLKRTRDFLLAGQLDEAQCELAFLSVLAPGAPDVLALDAELTRRQQAAERAIQEAKRKQVEEARERDLLLRKEIDRCVAEAEELRNQERFDEALRVLTDAYLLDPNSDVVEACENRIVDAQRQWEERMEMERRAHEAAARRAEEEAQLRRAEEERLRLIAEEEERDRDRHHAAEQEIAVHVAAARTSLADRRFREALAEVALAFMLDPLSEEVKLIEQEILARQSEANRSADEPAAPIELPPDVEATLETSARFLADAKRLAQEQRFVAALHEANKALSLDPDNLATKKVIAAIKAEYEVYQDAQKTPRPRAIGGRGSSHLRLAKPPEAPKPDNIVQLIRQDLETEAPVLGQNPAPLKGRWWNRVKDAWREAVAEAEAESGLPERSEDEKPPSAEIPTRILRML